MRMLLASLLFTTACSTAYADRPTVTSVGPRTALAVAPDRIRAPYDVQIITESGETAPTYAYRGRYYVQGSEDERYTIRVANPTGHRVEAVVTVDGLDVVDGEAGDLKKRGYIVPAYGEVNIEGFRTSLSDVATFRFSSVDNSYAGQKGKARNVGVIAVAIFEEAAPPPETQIIVPQVTQRPPYHWRDDGRVAQGRARAEGKASKATAPSAAPTESAGAAESAPSVGGASGAGRVAATPPPPAASSRSRTMADSLDGGYYEPAPAPRTNRPGLGTEFGEARYSAASYTKFNRATRAPIAIAELRYNDVAGLVALGIPVQPIPDENELLTRETADPFPGDYRFARPPGR